MDINDYPAYHPKCDGLIGWLRGHNFQPVYSIDERKTPKDDLGTFFSGTTTGKQPNPPQDTFVKTYHGHVCSRCGLASNRQGAK